MLIGVKKPSRNQRLASSRLNSKNDKLRLGEIIDSHVIRVFDNGKILVDLKGTPMVAATTVPLRQGTAFTAVVRRNGSQKWLKILYNGTESRDVGDFDYILQELGLGTDAKHLLVLQVLLKHNYEPNRDLIESVSTLAEKYDSVISDKILLVESVLYLISLGIDVTQKKILYATALLGSNHLLGDRLNQIRHYVKVSCRRNLPAKETTGLSSVVDKISLRIPGAFDHIFKDSELDRRDDDSPTLKLFNALSVGYFDMAETWIALLTDVRKHVSNLLRINRRSIDLLDQSIRLVYGLVLSGQNMKVNSQNEFFYFQLPIFYGNRISTIEGRVMQKNVVESQPGLDGEAVWKKQGENIAYFQFSFSEGAWQTIIKTSNLELASIIEREFSDFSSSRQDERSRLLVECDNQFIANINGFDLRWPLPNRKNHEIDIVI